MDWNQRVLEELIYERVRVHLDLAELLDFERDLDESIGRALRQAGLPPAEARALTRRHITAALRRIEEDGRRAGEADGCPLCAAPLECPPALAA